MKINAAVYTDPVGTLTIGLIALCFGVVLFVFYERLLFSKRGKPARIRKWEKVLFKFCAIVICLGGFYFAVVGTWIVMMHR